MYSSFNDVLFDGFDRHAGLTQPREGTFNLVAVALKLDCDQTHLFGNTRAANVKQQVEFLDEVVENRLFD